MDYKKIIVKIVTILFSASAIGYIGLVIFGFYVSHLLESPNTPDWVTDRLCSNVLVSIRTCIWAGVISLMMGMTVVIHSLWDMRRK